MNYQKRQKVFATPAFLPNERLEGRVEVAPSEVIVEGEYDRPENFKGYHRIRPKGKSGTIQVPEKYLHSARESAVNAVLELIRSERERLEQRLESVNQLESNILGIKSVN